MLTNFVVSVVMTLRALFGVLGKSRNLEVGRLSQIIKSITKTKLSVRSFHTAVQYGRQLLLSN